MGFDSVLSNAYTVDEERYWRLVFGWIHGYVNHRGIDTSKANERVIERHSSGRVYDMSDHLRGLLLSVLSAQRPWAQIQANLDRLEGIFCGYNPDSLKAADPAELADAVCEIGCGNRRIRKQMEEIRYNVGVLERIKRDTGDVDSFCRAASGRPDKVMFYAETLSNKDSAYKLKGVGLALALQYMKNLGVDAVKPDVHLLRIIKRLGWYGYDLNEYDVYNTCRAISKGMCMTMSEIGFTLWAFCATGYCEVCTADPKCSVCPVACKYNEFQLTEEGQNTRDLITWNKYFSKSADKFAEANALIDEVGTTDLHVLCEYIREKENETHEEKAEETA